MVFDFARNTHHQSLHGSPSDVGGEEFEDRTLVLNMIGTFPNWETTSDAPALGHFSDFGWLGLDHDLAFNG
jgi:hypothetical protein